MTESPKHRIERRKYTNLELADQMFKDAFLVKRTRFSHLYPQLSKAELHQMTVDYFKKLNQEDDR